MSNYQDDRMKRKLGILPPLPTKKEKKAINKISDKKRAEQKAAGDKDGLLDAWFVERRKEMVGRCALCNGKTEKDNDETYRRSIHHLLDKRKGMFPSVATHPSNWLEVCFYGNSCHTNIHNKTITWELLYDSREWIYIEIKLKSILPFLDKTEYSRLPDIIQKHFKL